MNSHGTIASLLTVCAISFSPLVNALIIDDFNGGTDIVFAPPSSSSNVAYTPGGPGLSGAIGGSHTIELDYISGPTTPSASINNFGIGAFVHNNGNGTISIASVIWDSNGAGLGGIDLTDGIGNDTLTIFFISHELGTLDISFIVTDTSGNSASQFFGSIGPGPESFLFSNFIDNQGTATNFSSVDLLRLDVSASTISTDLTIDFIETGKAAGSAPTPSTIALLFIGFSSMSIVRRKRRRI